MPFFFPDPDHEDRTHIDNLCELLPALIRDHKITTLFLEFLYIETTDRDLEEDFTWCSKRPKMAKPYALLAETAKKLGLRVVGLSMPLYTTDMNRQVGAGLAFRWLGGFDIVASEIIFQHAVDPQFVVFLGAGHFQFLSQHIPSMELIGKVGEEQPVEMSEMNLEKARSWTGALLRGLIGNAVKLVLSNTTSTLSITIRTLKGDLITMDVPSNRQESQLQVVTFGQKLPLSFPSSKVKLKLDWERFKYPHLPTHRLDAIWSNFYDRTGSGNVLRLKAL